MIKKALVIFLLFLLTSCVNKGEIYQISDKWDIYDSHYILSDDGHINETPNDKLYFSGNHKQLEDNNVYNYGSIRQKIKVKNGDIYTLYISGILSSCKIWVDSELLGEYGEIGNTLDSSYPEIKRSLINFTAKSDTADVVIEFSNFHFKSKFLFKWIVYGKSRDIMSLYLKNQSKDYITTGLLFICSILFLLIFFIDTRNKYNLYFSLFTLSYGIRSYLIKNTTIEGYFPWFDWVLTFQFNKASELWALAFMLMFMVTLYPREFNNKISKTIVLISLISSLFAFIPLDLFNKYNVLLLMHIEVLITGFYIIFNLIRSVFHKCYLSKWALGSISLFFTSIIFDIFADRTILVFDYYSAQVVILVVIVMFFIIARKRSDSSYYVSEKEKTNSNIRRVFSMFVPIEILSKLNNNSLEDRPPGDFSVEAVTIIYIDIRNFTSLSEGLTPAENFALINNFYDIVGVHVKNSGGYIESYGGDGVKAIFPYEPDKAIETAVNISNRVNVDSGIKIGMSIHFGKVVFGTIGGGNRIQATAISSITRILSAMDQFNSKMGIEILITERVFALTTITKESTIYLGNIILNNEEFPLKLYQVIPEHNNIDPDFREAFESGVYDIQNKNFSRAYGFFTLAAKYNPNDKLTKTYLIELKKFLKLRELTFMLKL